MRPMPRLFTSLTLFIFLLGLVACTPNPIVQSRLTELTVATPDPLLATPQPVPDEGSLQGQSPESPNQGCYLFQNQLGAELTVTMTRMGGTESVSFQVPSDQEIPYCLDVGHYTYTIDAPPPWALINGELDVKAGDRFLFPVGPQ